MRECLHIVAPLASVTIAPKPRSDSYLRVVARFLYLVIASAGSIRGLTSWHMEAKMALNAPHVVMYLIALVLAVAGLLAYFGVLGGMVSWAFWLMVIAFIVLAGAVLVKAS